MKSLLIIWLLALLASFVVIMCIEQHINTQVTRGYEEMRVREFRHLRTIDTYNPQQTIDVSNLQGGE